MTACQIVRLSSCYTTRATSLLVSRRPILLPNTSLLHRARSTFGVCAITRKSLVPTHRHGIPTLTNRPINRMVTRLPPLLFAHLRFAGSLTDHITDLLGL